MRDEDINNAIKNLAATPAGKTMKDITKGILFATIALLSLLAIFIIIELFDVVVHYNKMTSMTYPLSNIVQPFLSGLEEKSEMFIDRDFGMMLMSVFIWLGLIFGECIPILYMKVLNTKEEVPEFQSRNYFMYLMITIGAIVYSVGYYKFWGLEIEWFYLLIRIVCSWFIFMIATKGIHLLVIGYNPYLAIILCILAILFLSFAFMFIFYSMIIIPFVLCVIGNVTGEVMDNMVFFFWI